MFARKTVSAFRDPSESFGSKSPKTPSCVSSVCAVFSFADTHQRENAYIAEQQLPLVPGGEVAGVVERGGGDLAEGTRVVAMTGGRGGYAQYAVAPAETTFPLPEGVDDGPALALL